MIQECKICGVSDVQTLEYLNNHAYPPQYIGFIVNYPKSKRFVSYSKLIELLKVNKKNSKYVAVLVKPNENILEKIKDLPFDYYQVYNTSIDQIKSIKKKYKKKIITAITVNYKKDVLKYKEYRNFADIILFDSKGYEKSLSFNHSYLDGLPDNFKKMIAGNIKIKDLKKLKNSSFIIDVSGALENKEGKKNINKIDKFLNTVHNINS